LIDPIPLFTPFFATVILKEGSKKYENWILQFSEEGCPSQLTRGW
jgi:hypothetical protein